MRNSSAISAGVPAPFPNLNPLRKYLDLLETVVDEPTLSNLETYIAYDQEFTATVTTSLDLWQPDTYSSIPLSESIRTHVMLGQIADHDSPEYTEAYGKYLLAPTATGMGPAVPTVQNRQHFGSEAGLRNAARGVVNTLVKYVASSGALPVADIRYAYILLNQSLRDVVDGNHKQLAFAHKRVKLDLLNLWRQEVLWRTSPSTGNREEVLRNVTVGWEYFGAPYGSIWAAKLIAWLTPKRYS